MSFAATAFTFHLANAAMLTSVSQLLGRTVGADKATSLVAGRHAGARRHRRGNFGALFPVIVAGPTIGSGRSNVSQGMVSSVFGLGAAMSASLAGWIIVRAGYTASFLTRAGIAAAGFVLYVTAMRETHDTGTPR